MHVRIRNFLHISQDVTIDYTNYHKKDQQKSDSNNIEIFNLNAKKIKIVADSDEQAIESNCCPSQKQVRNEEGGKDNNRNNSHLQQGVFVLRPADPPSGQLSHDVAVPTPPTTSSSNILLIREIVATKLNKMVNATVTASVVQEDKTKNITLDKYLQTTFLQKYKATKEDRLWSTSRFSCNNSIKHWQTKNDLADLSNFIRVLSGNNPVRAGYLLRDFLNNNKGVQKNWKRLANVL